MRKLLDTLFVLTDGRYLSFKDGHVIVWEEDKKVKDFPLINLENIVSFSWKGASIPLLDECAKRGIGVSFINPSGKLRVRLSGESRGNVLLRRQQYRLADSPESSCAIARNFIFGKIYNSRSVLSRAMHDHGPSIDCESIQSAVDSLNSSLRDARSADTIDTLRGIEGNAAGNYFSVFGKLILKNQETFAFTERTRRPPTTPTNALLSLTYTMLAQDCANALESVGLDAYVGYMHTDRAGRCSLALDLMEELRSIFADRFVLKLINNKMLNSKDFEQQESGAVLLTENGRRKFFQSWQEKKYETLKHPFLGEKLPWGLIPYVQALLLARTIRGDLDEYPAFLWK